MDSNKKKKLHKNVWLLGFTSLLTDISTEMIFPILPLFLVNVLKADMSVVGLIDGIAESTANILKMFSGWYSDRIGKRKPFVILGYGFSTITKPFFALARIWPHVLIVRFLDRVGKGIRGSTRDAILADSIDESIRGKAFGIRKAMDALGATIGPLITFLLLGFLVTKMDIPSSYRTIFWLSFIPAIIAVFLLLFVEEKERKITSDTKVPSLIKSFKSFNREFKVLVLIAIIFGLGNFSFSFILLKSKEIGISEITIPLLYLFFNLFYTIFAMPSGILSDRIGRKNVLGLGYVLWIVTCIGFALSYSPLFAWLFIAVYGIFMAIVETVQRAFITDIVPKEMRGTALGIYQGAMGFSAFPASFISGLLWHYFGSNIAFIYGATLGLIATIMLFVLVKEDK